MIYDQAFNNSFHQKNTSLQYNAALAITGAIWSSFNKDAGIESYVSIS